MFKWFAFLTAWLWLPTAFSAQEPVLSLSQASDRLAAGGYVLMMRHAIAPGTGDPAGFSVDKCGSQRNLSSEGRSQAQSIGQKLRAAGIHFSAVRNSQWCRCRDTAMLAFGRSDDWPALNSFFADRSTEPDQTRELHQAAQRLPANENVIWVSHQVNISAALSTYTRQGEILAAKARDGKLELVFRIKL